MKPVCYLDIDDTLLIWTPAWAGIAAPGAKEFLLWLLPRFEVRWLTLWCPSGTLHLRHLQELSDKLDLPTDVLGAIVNPHEFGIRLGSWDKMEGVAVAEHRAGRPFVWIEDQIHLHELQQLEDEGWADRWIACNVTERPERLREVWDELKVRFPDTQKAEG